jgi:NAD(P)H dehydrogenase (quinone)
MVRRVLVTGATGRIGGQLVPRLAGHNDLAVRAFVRSAKKAAPLETSGAELALGRFEDPPSVRIAMDGIDTVVLITPASPDAADQASSVLAAAKAANCPVASPRRAIPGASRSAPAPPYEWLRLL